MHFFQNIWTPVAIGVLDLYKLSYEYTMHIPITKQNLRNFGKYKFTVVFRIIPLINVTNTGPSLKFLEGDFRFSPEKQPRWAGKNRNFENRC